MRLSVVAARRRYAQIGLRQPAARDRLPIVRANGVGQVAATVVPVAALKGRLPLAPTGAVPVITAMTPLALPRWTGATTSGISPA